MPDVDGKHIHISESSQFEGSYVGDLSVAHKSQFAGSCPVPKGILSSLLVLQHPTTTPLYNIYLFALMYLLVQYLPLEMLFTQTEYTLSPRGSRLRK